MQINAHAASRVKRRDKCKLVFSRTDCFNGLVLSVIKKQDFTEEYIKYPGTAGIWEGREFCIIAYFN